MLLCKTVTAMKLNVDRRFLETSTLWRWQRGGFAKVMELTRGRYLTNGATPSSFVTGKIYFDGKLYKPVVIGSGRVEMLY